MYKSRFKEANNQAIIQKAIDYIANSKNVAETYSLISKSAKGKFSNIPGIGKVDIFELDKEINSERSDSAKKIVGVYADMSIQEYSKNPNRTMKYWIEGKAERSQVWKQKYDKFLKLQSAKSIKLIKQSKFLQYIAGFSRLSNSENEIQMIIQNSPNATPKIKMITNSFPTDGGWFSSLSDFIKFNKENTIPGIKYLSDSEFKTHNKNVWNKNKVQFMLLFNKFKQTKNSKVRDEIFKMAIQLGMSLSFLQEKFREFMRA